MAIHIKGVWLIEKDKERKRKNGDSKVDEHFENLLLVYLNIMIIEQWMKYINVFSGTVITICLAKRIYCMLVKILEKCCISTSTFSLHSRPSTLKKLTSLEIICPDIYEWNTESYLLQHFTWKSWCKNVLPLFPSHMETKLNISGYGSTG